LVTRTLLTSLPLVCCLAGLAGTSPASAGTPAGIVRPTLVLGVATPVPAGVKVGPTGAEWALPGGARLSAEADTELRVIAAPQHLDLGGKHKVPSYTVMLKSGLVRAYVPSGGATAIVVAAPRKASVIVAAGEASVVAGAEVAVANAQGSTSFGIVGQPFHAVEPGMVEVVGAPKRPLLRSPVLTQGTSVLLSFGDPATLGAFAWDAVPDAHGYRVELRDEKSHRILARTATDGTTLRAGFATLEPGAYSLRLTAVDAVGLESADPVIRPVSVLSLGLPPGGFVDAEGIVRYPPGANIELAPVEGVEMGYGHQGGFLPAPPSLGLYRAQPSVVRFRAAGAAASSAQELWFIPRTTRAKIAFGPRAPSWPGAPLEIDVRLDDAAGAPGGLQVTPVVTVGVEAVPVDFTHDGMAWHGVLPPRAGKGPWVVRVEVKDQHGVELGRDFVEIVDRAGG
jgi:hypothetical protein